MFGGGSFETDGDVAMAAVREADWKALHRRLRTLAKQRVALEAEEASYLVEAEESRLYRRLGYTSMLEYMERELHWGRHAAKERLRVAHDLIDLPRIAERFRDGELCFSAVRELTRVATPETEDEFLAKARGKTARQVEQMVSGLKRGDQPDAEPDPALITKRITMEVSVETYAMLRRTRTALDDERGARLSDDEMLQTLCRRANEAPAEGVTRPAVQAAVTTCRNCKRNFVGAAGESLEIAAATAERLLCDAEHVGDLESDEATRVRPTIPNAIRRKVLIRDNFACVVPGCPSTRGLEVHHVIHREHGGGHQMWNLLTACFGCHQRHHDGLLMISGRAPDRLVFAWRREEDVESAMTPGPTWDGGPAGDDPADDDPEVPGSGC